MKKAIAFVSALVLAMSMAACGSDNSGSDSQASQGSSAASSVSGSAESGNEAESTSEPEAAGDGTVYQIGICQLVQHDALDAATQGFKDALTELLGEGGVEFSEQNASGDSATCATIINQFVSSDVDLMLANGTAALQAAAAGTDTIPTLGTSITDYGTALDMADWSGTTGRNISGTSDLAPLQSQADMLHELFPDATNVGLLYCSAEANSAYQVENVQAALEEYGYTCTPYTFADSNDIASVVTTASSECDVIYIPTDNTAASNTEVINNVCLPAGVPIVAGEEGICSGCGVATLSIDYYDLGYKTGEMAYEILVNGADITTMEVETADATTKKYDADRCAELNIEVPDDYVAIGE
jgi:putative ABC transport system substrate-binding protein